MIEIKATRRGAEPAPDAGPHTLSEERPSSTRPLALVALLSVLIVYVRSMFGGEATAAAVEEAAPPQDAPAAPNEAAATPSEDGAALPVTIQEDGPAAAASSRGPGAKTSGATIDPAPVLLSSARIDLPVYAAPEPRLPIVPTRNLDALAANDNAASPAAAKAGGAVTGAMPEEAGEDDPDDANRAPRVSNVVHLSDIFGCAPVVIGLADLLRHATDPDGDPLTVRNLKASSGTLTQEGDGWRFDPDGSGMVTITYLVSDGSLSVAQTAHINVLRTVVTGGAGNDVLVGTACGDDIDGGAGDDRIDGRGGHDVIHGGDGDDHIEAGAGNDTVYAGAGDDVVLGGAGNDWIWGGGGNDRLSGGEGDDVIFGEAGSDTVEGDAGADMLFGGAGDDTLSGGHGGDRLMGGDGDDVLTGGAGRDFLQGEDGDDVVKADADRVADTYEGGEDFDTLDYSAATRSLRFDLLSGRVTGVEVGEDVIAGFETFIGGSGSDHFIGGVENARFKGGGGGDLYEFGHVSIAGTDPQLGYEIHEFMAGDRIRISRFEIFEKALDTLEDRFEDTYGDGAEDDLPIRIRHERTDEYRKVLIEADLDGDARYELAVTIVGDVQVTMNELS